MIAYQAAGPFDQTWLLRPVGYLEIHADELGRLQAALMVTVAPAPIASIRSGLFPGADPAIFQHRQLKLPRSARLSFRLYVWKQRTSVRTALLELIDQAIALFPDSSKRVINFDDASADEDQDMRDRGLTSFPTVIVEYRGEQLLRFGNLPDIYGMHDQLVTLRAEAEPGDAAEIPFCDDGDEERPAY